MKKYTLYTLFASAVFPLISFAALDGVRGFLTSAKSLINLLLGVVFGLAVLFFFWGIAQFILNDSGNEKTRAEGKTKIVWGIIALFIMVSIYGILAMIGGLLGVETRVTPGNSTGGNSGTSFGSDCNDTNGC